MKMKICNLYSLKYAHYTPGVDDLDEKIENVSAHYGDIVFVWMYACVCVCVYFRFNKRRKQVQLCVCTIEPCTRRRRRLLAQMSSEMCLRE